MSQWAARPDQAGPYDEDHKQEDQRTAQDQCQVEAGRFVPVQLFKSKHGREVFDVLPRLKYVGF